MPGGFHPFHAGHYALYQSALKAFPGADVVVAATNDTSARPFPFKIKEKLAQLAGVAPGAFYQVKSPFRAEEITKNYNPEDTELIFVRSEKDANKPPQAGGTKKNGEPAYLQPLAGQNVLYPMNKHAYMAYLPTVEFGPGMTSATEIRTAWPKLNDKRKTALVMSLYPRTQTNPKLAATVVKMLDTAIGEQLNEFLPAVGAAIGAELAGAAELGTLGTLASRAAGYKIGSEIQNRLTNQVNETASEDHKQTLSPLKQLVQKLNGQTVSERKKENDTDVRSVDYGKLHDPELIQAKQFAKVHYPGYSDDPEEAFDKWVQRGLKHSEENDRAHDKKLRDLSQQIDQLKKELQQVQGNADYIEEKWSQKYKRSIDCSHPRGFSQRAHCAGRKK